jgi:hypothetical protein
MTDTVPLRQPWQAVWKCPSSDDAESRSEFQRKKWNNRHNDAPLEAQWIQTCTIYTLVYLTWSYCPNDLTWAKV